MKKILRNLLIVFFVMLVVTTLFQPSQALAAKKATNLEMYIGESYEYTNFSEVKSIKNAKKAIVAANKRKDNNKYVVFTAKKAGKTTLTINTKSGTMVYNLVVKKSKFTTKLIAMGKGEILVEISNDNKAIFEDGVFKYTLKGADDTEYAVDDIRIESIVPGKKSYASIHFNQNSFEPDLSKSTIKMVSLSRSPSRKYANIEKNLKVTDKIKEEAEDKLVVSINTKNTGKVTMDGYLFIVFYDPSGAPIGFTKKNVYLKPGAVDTGDATCYLNMIDYETKQRVAYDHYEIIKNVYSSEYAK